MRRKLDFFQQVVRVSIFIYFLLSLGHFSSRAHGRAYSSDRDLDTTSPGLEINSSSDANYRVYLVLAQEEAKCLRDYGGEGGEDGENEQPNKSSPFANFRCIKGLPTFGQCEQCRNYSSGIPTGGRCEEVCLSDDSCLNKCLALVEKVEQATKWLSVIETLDDLTLTPSRVKLNPPEVLCEDMSLPEAKSQFHIVVLKWSLELNFSRNETAGIASGDSKATPTPYVFVLQRMDMNAALPRWETRGKTLSLIQPLNSPYASKTYRYRITAVSPDGPVGRAASGEIRTLQEITEANPPVRIYKLKEIVHDDSIDILVGWDPSEDKPCDYKVIQNRQDDEGKSITQRFTATDLEYGLQTWFYDLKFKQTYEVSITSRRGNYEGGSGMQSGLKSEVFIMPSCLMAHNHRFDKCVPSPPRNLSFEHVVITEDSANEDEDKRGQVKVNWDPPLHTSEQNRLKSYTLILGKPEPDRNNNNSMVAHSAFGIAALTESLAKYIIPGDVTQFVLKDLLLNHHYQIALIATSIKGDSTPIYHKISTYAAKEDESESLVTSWIYLCIPISLMILAIVGCHFLRLLVQKRQVKQARNQYFQSMDERDAMSPDWSIVPLNDDYSTHKSLHDGPREKWEISYDNLIMGEVIGQGAFGVVRRAKMARRKNPGNGPKYSPMCENGEVDENGMETVAVKMLKVSATRDDREQLIKEIVTMQHLGGHPQIVSLLGACTKGRSLCLVLEFCPGGDLLSFLRKVRAKYWPTLGFSNNRQSWSDKSLEKQDLMKNTTSGESGCNSGDSHNSSRRSNDTSHIHYGGMIPSYGSSRSPHDLVSPADTVINHQYGKIPVAEPEDDCRPIDEKDILSYARQIAMGMEFLEKNRVVHRDLAGRNVLLLGDYKQVKISDFGLSRDIYTWNVYHQKSNGKLPIKWMAIESIFTHVFTSKSDVWSFGILLWELVTLGGTPYPGLGNTELFNLLKSGYRMERPDNCSEEIYALMKKCWRTSPVSRPNFTELRCFLETMLEAAEPSLYLSLMADIPVDYFHLSSRSDLIPGKLTDDSPLTENSGGLVSDGPTRSQLINNASNQDSSNLVSKRVRSKRASLTSKHTPSTPSVPDLGSASSQLLSNQSETSSSTAAIGQLGRTENQLGIADGSSHPLLGSTTNSTIPIRSHPSFRRTQSQPLRSNSNSRMPLNESLLEKRSFKFGGSSESAVSPDSGNPRSESEAGGPRDLDDSWSDPEIDCNAPLKRPNTLQTEFVSSCSSSPRGQRSIPLTHFN